MSKETVSVIGLGFVGFPTACILANKENYFKVIGIDKNIKKISTEKKEALSKKLNLFEDKYLNNICKKVIKKNKIFFTDKIKYVNKSKIIIISINFDFEKNKFKKIKELKDFFSNLSKFLKKGTMILIETTLPPGTCDNIILPTIKSTLNKRKMKISDIFLCYAFERVMPGKFYAKSITDNYKCFAGMNKISGKKCKIFLKKYINYKRYPLFQFDNIIDCESAKILENSYRAINIAFIDEWTKFSYENNIKLNQIIDAIKLRKSHNNIMRPGLGVGGYCLTKDPEFINFSAKKIFNKKTNFPITNTSLKINRNMVFSSIKFIKNKIKNLKNKKILILGASYKDNVSDTRESPSIILSKEFKKNKINSVLHDPITSLNDNKKYGISNKLPLFRKFDLVLFCVKHHYYNKINFKKFSKKPIYFDLNCVLDKKQINYFTKNNFKVEVLGGK